MVHCHVHKSLPLLSSHLYPGLPSSPFPSGFLIKILYAFPVSPMCAKCTAHLTLLDFITLIIFGEGYKL